MPSRGSLPRRRKSFHASNPKDVKACRVGLSLPEGLTMDIGPYVAFSTEVQQINGRSTTVITCLTDELTQDQLAPSMDLIVYGDEITISGPLCLPGQNMTIIARIVTLGADASGAGASVDLSGDAGVPVSPPQAA